MELVIGMLVVALGVAIIWWLLKRRSQIRDGGAATPPPAENMSPGTEEDARPASSSEGTVGNPRAESAATEGPEVVGDDRADRSSEKAVPAVPEGTADREPSSERVEADVSSTDKDEPRAQGSSTGTSTHAAQDRAEWEVQWSDAEGTQTAAPSGDPAGYNPPPSPMLPDVEAAAVEVPDEARTTATPRGHLAAEEPYGAGSASPAPDGSGPPGYTVKGDATTMVYYDEADSGYEEAVCNVWFLSPAHAEAAGFRAPRRMRR